MKIFITHCSGKKSEKYKDTGEAITPDKLYTSKRIKSFINKCRSMNVKWAIFSDKYGVWFPNEKHEWYDKSPDNVNEDDLKPLVKNFDEKLLEYDEIWFYHNPARFHSTYKDLLNITTLKDKIIMFSRIKEIDGR